MPRRSIAAGAEAKMKNPILIALNTCLTELRKAKPGDRSEKDRKFAICITQTEILIATIKGLLGEFINE
jgi:hypothetical protein